MKLEIWRNQKDEKGVFGGHKGVGFSLVARVQLDEDEKALIARYRVENEVLATFQRSPDMPAERVTINELLQGKTTYTRDIADLLALEDELKDGCVKLKTYLAVMRTFGGYEALEI
ncbi:MAG: hypothetical protein HY825_15735 [Acidobacteria bacterium]|nr:hypothetical protein [Acidobacteriota bacterium]